MKIATYTVKVAIRDDDYDSMCEIQSDISSRLHFLGHPSHKITIHMSKIDYPDPLQYPDDAEVMSKLPANYEEQMTEERNRWEIRANEEMG
jgi:hypothetical protein